jgi:hypothetical protein
MSHNFTTVVLSCHRQSITSLARVRARIIPFGFRDVKSLQFSCFSPGTFQSPVHILALTLRTHTLTTVHSTQSHNSTPSLTKTSVCVYLKNINKNPVSSLVFCIQKGTDCCLSLNSCMLLRGRSGNWWSCFETWQEEVKWVYPKKYPWYSFLLEAESTPIS